MPPVAYSANDGVSICVAVRYKSPTANLSGLPYLISDALSSAISHHSLCYTVWMFCECGCGQRTPLSPRNDPRGRYCKGEPLRYIRGHQSRRSAPQYRVDKNGCWVWLWTAEAKGYGQVRRGPRMTQAHKAYWEDQHGPVPTGMELHHTCQNKSCVNPTHLELLTPDEHAQKSWTPRRRQEQAVRMKAIQPLGQIALGSKRLPT